MGDFKFALHQRVCQFDSTRMSFVEHRFAEDGENFYVLHDNSRWPISPRVPESMVRVWVPAGAAPEGGGWGE